VDTTEDPTLQLSTVGPYHDWELLRYAGIARSDDGVTVSGWLQAVMVTVIFIEAKLGIQS
jgi:hypothetical protein